MRDSHFEEKKENIKKKVIPMESTKIPKMIIKKQLKKGVIKKQLKKVDKAIVEIAEMKFENYEEKEEKLDALVFLKNQILTEARELL